MKIKSKWKLLVFILLLVIGIGYAVLSATLKISGTSGIKSGKWIIYFDNIQNESGVVSTETKITNDKQEVDFNITLTKPGDYYEFDVDTVNDGTIDAMIDSAEFGELDDSLKDLVYFDVTYKDGTEIKKCDTLPKESRKTITVKVNYKEDITEKDLINEDKSLNLTFTINYVQKSVCENYPTIIVDPNGGTYNGSTKLTKIKTSKNSDNLLDTPLREGYEFLYFKTIDGTTLEKDENGKTNVHVENDDIKVIAEWQEDNTPRYIVTIDPDGGVYKEQTGISTSSLKERETLTLEEPTRDGYIFYGWEEVTETSSLNNNVVTMPAANVTVKAVWKTEADYVARIENKYYTTIQKAFDAAVTGDKVWLLKSTTENATNVKDISFDLGGFTVTGTIINSGTLTIDNGRISNTESSPFVNTGTVNVGTHDGNMIADSIVIFGGSDINGLTQNGTFNFYDGYIEGKIAVTDIYNELEEGYYYIVDHDDENNCQKAYLSPEIDAIVKRIDQGKDVYYKLLQDAIDMTSNENPNIYAIKNFETSKDVVISSNQKVVFDIKGYTILEGAKITNNGEFTILDSKEEKGVFSPSLPIVNNNKLNITNAVLTQATTAGNLIENSGNLNITNSTLTANNGYALDIKTGGTLDFDNNTTIRANSYGIYNEANDEVKITGGNIVGIYNIGNDLKIENSTLVNGNTRTITSTKGNIVLKNVNANYNLNDNNYLLHISNGDVQIINGSYSGKCRNIIYATNSTLQLDAVNITNSQGGGIEVNDSTVDFNSGEIEAVDYSIIVSGSSNFNVNGGKVSSSYEHTVFIYSGYIYINGGEIDNTSNRRETISNDYNGNVIINGGIVKSSNLVTIISNSRGSTVINGGTIISTGTTAIYNSKTLTVTGGTIIGAVYGVNNTSTLIIGSNDSEVKTDSPVIRGETYGIYSTNNITFYDGILEGKTDGYYGTITTVPTDYEVVKNTIEIDEETYIEEHLAVKKDFLQVGSTKFNSLQKAIDSIDEEGTIKVIADANITEESTLPNNKNITLDLNGHKLLSTRTITNNGTFNLKDSDTSGEGEFSSYNALLLNNTKNVNFISGNYKSNSTILYQNSSSAILKVSGGYYLSTSDVTLNNSNGKIIVEGGEIEGSSNNAIRGYSEISGGYIHSSGSADTINGSAEITGGKIYSQYRTAISGGTLNIYSGEISTDSGSGIYCGICNIYGGKIDSKTGKSISSGSASTVRIYDGEFTSESGNAFDGGRSSSVKITGGLFKSTNGNAYRDDFYSTPTINGGTFISENGIAIALYEGNEFKMLGGTAIGKTYGIHVSKSGFNLVLGTEGEGVSTTSPVIIGGTSGIRVDNGNFDFYDGIVKGIESSYNATIRKVEDSYVIKDDTEEIDGTTYKTAYPAEETDFLEVNGETFNSLRKAINHIESTGTIKVIENKVVNSEATVPAEKNITLDLNGKELTLYQPITNSGTLNVLDSVGDGKLSSFGSTAIENSGTLNITGGVYNVSQKLVNDTTSGTTVNITGATITAQGNAINVRYSTLNMDNVTVSSNGDSSIYTRDSSGTLNNLNIDTLGNGIYFYDSSLTVTNSEITANYNAISLRGAATIENCNLNSRNSSAIYHDWGSTGALIINSGTLTGKTYGIEQNSGDTQINGGVIKGGSFGIYANTGVVTIGTNDDNIVTNTPLIQGERYGIYTVNGPTINFYDGIIKGKTAVASITLQNIVDDSFVKYDIEEIDEETYQVAYLVKNVDFIENQTTKIKYNNLNTALTAANDNDELKLIDNASLYYAVEIPNKKLTINMNNKTITTINTITNNGEISIIDDSSEKGGTFTSSTNISMIKNNNKLVINNTKITASNSGQYMIQNTTFGAELSLSNVTISSYYSIDNTQKLDIINSNVSSVKNDSGNVSIESSTINSERNSLYNYNGVLSVNNSSVTCTTLGGSSNYAYYNNVTDENISKNTITNSKLYSGRYGKSLCNANGTLEVKNTSNIYNGFTNQAVLNVSNSYITHSANEVVSNDGNLTINDSTTEYNWFTNSGTFIGNNSTFNCVKYSGSQTYITNSGDMTLNSSTINAIDTKYTISNSRNLNLNSAIINSNSSTESKEERHGIDNSGIVNFNSGKLEITKASTGYGIYADGGVTNIKNVEIKLSDSTSVYGIYLKSGEVTLGELEDPLSVSTTNPIVTAIGTTSGIGVKKLDGIFNYYDGIITGSTEAKPEAPTDIPTRYRIVFNTDSNGYQNCTLEYVP